MAIILWNWTVVLLSKTRRDPINKHLCFINVIPLIFTEMEHNIRVRSEHDVRQESQRN